MKKLLLAAVIALLPVASFAGEMKFPSDAPFATVTFPDGWNAKEGDSGIEAQTADDAIYYSLDVVTDGGELDGVMSTAAEFLDQNGVTLAPDTKIEFSDVTFNGMPAKLATFNGTYQEATVHIGFAIVKMTDTSGVVITYWGDEGAEKTYEKDLAAIEASLKPIQ